MVQAMTGACVTLLQPMQRGIYQKPLMTLVPHDHSYLKQNKTRKKKKGRGEWSQVGGAGPLKQHMDIDLRNAILFSAITTGYWHIAADGGKVISKA